MREPPEAIRLIDLVEHADQLDTLTTLTASQGEFTRRKRRFLGVTSGKVFVGLASAREITELLSNQFGHALFGRANLGKHVMTDALIVADDLPITELLKLVAARSEEAFDQDIALISPHREFLGLIPLPRIVRLQTGLLLDNLARVEAQRVELAERHRLIEEDLRLARQMQLALLPENPLVVRAPGLRVETRHVYQAADLIGGDFFTTTCPGPGLLACGIFDVMGHGVRPALITAILRALMEESAVVAADPGAMLTHLNHSLRGVLRGSGDFIFVTAGYAVLDLARRELRYAQAGHPAPLLWHAREAAPLRLTPDSAGPALGLIDDYAYTVATAPFGPGDALVLYTDGLTEIATPDGAEFGSERLRQALANACGQDSPDVPGALLATARAYAGTARFDDDVCVLLARCVAE
ncbi:MAG: SpoIIE family protein phosphatase [Burkholderiales bacterium]|nr:SpoIIE family protein phosphatase [Opitutaceae bacterium]